MLKASSLHERTFKSSEVLPSLASTIPSRCPAYKGYHEEQICRAYEAVKDGLSVRRAAEQYGIPRSTLGDRITGRVKFGAHSGPQRYLSDDEERELVSFICQSARMGYAKTRKEVLAIVEKVVASKGKQVQISNGWWVSFRQRYPYLTLRTVEKLSYARLVASDVSVINRYFDLLEQTLLENGLMERPSQIFNCDESGLPLDHTPSSVIAIRGQKHPRAVTSGKKKQITVLACATAAGRVLPPLVIFGRKALNPALTKNEVPGTMYGLSSKGWMDSEIFQNWFTHHFLVHAPSLRPLLLLLDGHSTHYNPSFVRRAAEERVIIFCLPPNTTHLTQPLDKGVFGPLKTYWNQECQSFMGKNPGRIVTEYDFMPVFSKAWYRTMTIPNIMSAFHTTGVYPFNRSAIEVVDSTPHMCDPKSLGERTGLAFIPLYSPAHQSSISVTAPSRHTTHPPVTFTSEETARFVRRYEEGFNITTDDRYNKWLKQYEQPREEQRDEHASDNSECRSSWDISVTAPSRHTTHPPVTFTSEETARFVRRYEEGFNITTDDRYNKWLKQYEQPREEQRDEHASDNSECRSSWDMSLEESFTENSPPANLLLGDASNSSRSVLKKLLHYPKPQPIRDNYEKKSARVLTSLENRTIIEEKERIKHDKENEKVKRKLERERKRADKLEIERKKKELKAKNQAGARSRFLAQGGERTRSQRRVREPSHSPSLSPQPSQFPDGTGRTRSRRGRSACRGALRTGSRRRVQEKTTHSQLSRSHSLSPSDTGWTGSCGRVQEKTRSQHSLSSSPQPSPPPGAIGRTGSHGHGAGRSVLKTGPRGALRTRSCGRVQDSQPSRRPSPSATGQTGSRGNGADRGALLRKGSRGRVREKTLTQSSRNASLSPQLPGATGRTGSRGLGALRTRSCGRVQDSQPSCSPSPSDTDWTGSCGRVQEKTHSQHSLSSSPQPSPPPGAIGRTGSHGHSAGRSVLKTGPRGALRTRSCGRVQDSQPSRRPSPRSRGNGTGRGVLRTGSRGRVQEKNCFQPASNPSRSPPPSLPPGATCRTGSCGRGAGRGVRSRGCVQKRTHSQPARSPSPGDTGWTGSRGCVQEKTHSQRSLSPSSQPSLPPGAIGRTGSHGHSAGRSVLKRGALRTRSCGRVLKKTHSQPSHSPSPSATGQTGSRGRGAGSDVLRTGSRGRVQERMHSQPSRSPSPGATGQAGSRGHSAGSCVLRIGSRGRGAGSCVLRTGSRGHVQERMHSQPSRSPSPGATGSRGYVQEKTHSQPSSPRPQRLPPPGATGRTGSRGRSALRTGSRECVTHSQPSCSPSPTATGRTGSHGRGAGRGVLRTGSRGRGAGRGMQRTGSRGCVFDSQLPPRSCEHDQKKTRAHKYSLLPDVAGRSSPTLSADGSSSPTLSAVSDTVCPACDTNLNKEWVACDNCDTWYHKECTDIPVEKYSKLSSMIWFCSTCEFN